MRLRAVSSRSDCVGGPSFAGRELLEELAELLGDRIQSGALDESSDVGARNDHVIVVGRHARQRPEGIAQEALDAVAGDRAADATPYRDAETRACLIAAFVQLIPRRRGTIARERVQDEIAVGDGTPMTVDPIELCASRQPPPLGPDRHSSNGQTRAPLAASSLEDRLAGARPHPGSKAVRASALALLWLIRPLHKCASWVPRTPEKLPAERQYKGSPRRSPVHRCAASQARDE